MEERYPKTWGERSKGLLYVFEELHPQGLIQPEKFNQLLSLLWCKIRPAGQSRDEVSWFKTWYDEIDHPDSQEDDESGDEPIPQVG
jgi:hypothetical protein